MQPNLVGFDTDFRLLDHQPSIVEIQFKSTLNTTVSFKLDLQTGRIFEIANWAPQAMIPNWHTDNPFTDWAIHIGHHIIQLYAEVCTMHSQQTAYAGLLSSLNNQTVRDIWIGKYGYRVHS